MPTIAEMQLLNTSLDDLTRVLQGNRALKQRREETDLDRAMRREEFRATREESALDRTMRAADAGDARENRRLYLESTKEHQAKMQEFQKLMLEATKEGNATERNEAIFRIMANMGKEGMLTDEAMDAMSEKFNQQFAPAGVGVKLFKRPALKGKPGTSRITIPLPEGGEQVIEQPLTDEDVTAAMNAIRAGKPKSSGDPVKDAQLARIDMEMKELTDAISKGDESSGLFGLGEGRVAKARRLQAERGKLLGNAAPSAPPSAAATASGVYKRDAGGKLIMSPVSPGAVAGEAGEWQGPTLPPLSGVKPFTAQTPRVQPQQAPRIDPAEAERRKRPRREARLKEILNRLNRPIGHGAPALSKEEYDTLYQEAQLLKLQLGL